MVPIAQGKQHINHIFFANDSLLFCKANSLELSRLIHMLRMYEKASSQRFNKEKTSIQLSRNTSRETQDIILSIAKVRSTLSYEKYLGLPTLVGGLNPNHSKLFWTK